MAARKRGDGNRGRVGGEDHARVQECVASSRTESSGPAARAPLRRRNRRPQVPRNPWWCECVRELLDFSSIRNLSLFHFTIEIPAEGVGPRTRKSSSTSRKITCSHGAQKRARYHCPWFPRRAQLPCGLRRRSFLLLGAGTQTSVCGGRCLASEIAARRPRSCGNPQLEACATKFPADLLPSLHARLPWREVPVLREQPGASVRLRRISATQFQLPAGRPSGCQRSLPSIHPKLRPPDCLPPPFRRVGRLGRFFVAIRPVRRGSSSARRSSSVISSGSTQMSEVEGGLFFACISSAEEM